MEKDTQDGHREVSRQETVNTIHKATKTEQNVVYYIRTKGGRSSITKDNMLVGGLIDLHMKKKKDDRIVIDYLISDVVVGKTDLGDLDLKTIVDPSGRVVLLSDYIRGQGEYGDMVSEEMKRLYRKLKDTQAVLARVTEK